MRNRNSFIAILALLSLTLIGMAQAATDIDARSVTLGSVSQSYCTSIDGVDYNSKQYFKSAADVLAKTGLTIQSQNTGNACCTAAKPWNGAACVAPIICPTGQELVSGVCQATTNSCAAIGKVLISGSCQLAAPALVPAGTKCDYLWAGGESPNAFIFPPHLQSISSTWQAGGIPYCGNVTPPIVNQWFVNTNVRPCPNGMVRRLLAQPPHSNYVMHSSCVAAQDAPLYFMHFGLALKIPSSQP